MIKQSKTTTQKATEAAPKTTKKETAKKPAPAAAAKPAQEAVKVEKKATPKAKPTEKKSYKSALAQLGGKKVVSHGVGRRKSSVARVWLKRGTGLIVVNGKEHINYFDTDINRAEAATPLRVVPNAEVDVLVNVVGGGLGSQAGAIKLGIARALVASDETLRPLLRQNDLLTVDARVKERKKYGQKAARRKFQFVKR